LEELTMAFRLKIGDREHAVEIVRRRPWLVVRIDGREHEITEPSTEADGRHAIGIGGEAVRFARAHLAERQVIRLDGRTFDVTLVDPRSDSAGLGGSQNHIRAPMPGSVVSIQKQAGDGVNAGETILTIESMKLQTALIAPRAGVIAEILRGEGQTFDKDEIIVRFEEVLEQAGAEGRNDAAH
jgi:3-methylcrotonyl-CoA carboxylase alpha subunit